MSPLRPVLQALALVASLSAAAHAGRGSIANGELNLIVYFTYDEQDPASWEPIFEEYSRVLSNATEGGLQLGTVTFTRCEELKEEADVWIRGDFSGARGHINGLGVLGRHITISQLHKSTAGVVRGQFGLVHETGHYLFGCYDEYQGFVGNSHETSGFHYCTASGVASACIMDGGSSVWPNNLRTEFCTRPNQRLGDTAHFPGVNSPLGQAILTDQEYFLGRSCWEQVERSGRGALLHPVTTPSQAFPPHRPVTFDHARIEGTLGVALVIDTSGSMSAEGRLDQARVGGKSVVGLLRDGEGLTIVGFDDVPRVAFPGSVMTPVRRAQADTALDGLAPGGGTVAGTAVLEAVNQLGRLQGCVELVLLVTDGVSGSPNVDDPAVLAALQGGGHALYAIAVGSFQETAALASVAAASGGAFFSVADASQLPGVIASIFTAAGTGTPVAVLAGGQIAPGGAVAETFEVAPGASELAVSLAYPAGADLDLSLVAPDGRIFRAATPPPGARSASSDSGRVFALPAPAAGTWTARVLEPHGAPSAFDLVAALAASELSICAGVERAEVVFPEPMRVAVAVTAGAPVGGARVTGEVTRPDGSEVAFELFDDGRAAHGDERAEDGVYSALFAAYAGDGAYAFDLTVRSEEGYATSARECGIFGLGEEGSGGGPLPPFDARAACGAVLAGAPVAPAAAALDLRSHPALLPATEVRARRAVPTPVAGLVIEVLGDEPVRLGPLALGVDVHAGSAAALDGLALHLDADGDGAPDRPSVPLALGRASADALVFGAQGGDLALLAPGTRVHLLVTAGEALPNTVSTASIGAPRMPRKVVGGTLGAGPGSGRGSWTAPLVLGLAGALALLLHARRRRGARPVLAAGVFVLLALSFPACTGGGDGAVPPLSTGAFELGLEPGGVTAQGTVHGLPAPVAGAPLRFPLTLR